MIGPDPLPPVTDEELARLRELCENTIKVGQFGVAVAVRDLYRVVSEFQQLRANWKKLEEINKG
jgi:hypothetical protein